MSVRKSRTARNSSPRGQRTAEVDETYQFGNDLSEGDIDYDPSNDNGNQNEGSTPTWVWVVMVIAGLAIIGLIIGLIIVATREDDTTITPVDAATRTVNATNSVRNVNITGISATSIRATWTWSPDAASDDTAILYVFPAGEDVQFNENGVPLTPLSNSGRVNNPVSTAMVSQLTPNATYNAKLVVTNPNRIGVLTTKDQTGITLSAPITLGPKFQIVASGQCGELSYRSTDPEFPNLPDEVFYTLGATNPNDSLFHRDSEGYICATTQTDIVTAETMCEDGSSILYDTGNAGTTSLTIGRKSDFTELGLSGDNARWQYNSSENKWCNRSGSRCIFYNVNAAPVVVLNDPTNPTSSTATITQPVFVNGTGSRWVNVNFVNTAL